MSWIDIPASTFSKYYQENGGEYDSVVNGDVYITLQYDDSAISPVSATLRFKLNNVNGYNYWDKYNVLLNPESSNRALYFLKTDYTKSWNDTTAKNKWPYYSSSFTLTKTYTADKFTVPALWLVNDGSGHASDADTCYKKYKAGGSRGVALRAAFNSSSISISKSTTVATLGSAPSISITDNGNNTFTISGKQGKNGTNNPIDHTVIYYTTNGVGPSGGYAYTKEIYLTGSSEKAINEVIHIPSTCNRAIAHAYSYYTYGGHNPNAGADDKSVKYYSKPSVPGAPNITYGKRRLTLRENWTVSWAASSGSVTGYRIRLYKKGPNETSYKAIPFVGENGTTLTTASHYYDTDSTNTSFTFYATKQTNLSPKDHIYFYVEAYLKNKKGNIIWNTTALEGVSATSTSVTTTAKSYNLWSTGASSTSTQIQNSGIMRVKVANNDWREGQVWVKINDTTWQEAEAVHVKTSNTTWSDSQ